MMRQAHIWTEFCPFPQGKFLEPITAMDSSRIVFAIEPQPVSRMLKT
jgi:hypothetical protein